MPEREEVLSALYGAYRLAWFDTAGMTHFNLSFDGFWRSFFAAALVAPAYAILVGLQVATGEQAIDLGLLVLTESIGYVLAWCAFPLIAIVLTRLLGLARNYVALIVALNWTAVLQTALFLAVVLLAPFLPEVLGTLVMTLTTGAILVYQWFVIRTALETTGGIALMLLLIDLIVTSMINMGADRVF
ncbi:MAG: hypothetical protein ACREJ5_06285 [Geminicoccaceae bacterium]